MDRGQFKELWKLRFEKMLSLEEQSIRDYGALLEECEAAYGEHSIKPHLMRLIHDEKKHVHLVKELLRILDRQV